MHYAKWAVIAALAALAVAAPATAATSNAPSGSGAILFASEKAAHDPNTGVPSFLVRPGDSYTFDVGGDVLTESSPGKTFASTIYPSWTFTYYRGVGYWKWTHYISYAADGQCILARYSNIDYDTYDAPGWGFQGDGAWTINQVQPQCYPLGTWWAGKEGHFYSWIWHQDDYPWQQFEAYATGSARTYDWGCNGSC